MTIERLAIVGVGLIGGSIGLAARERGLAQRVIGLGRNKVTLEEAVALRAIDEGHTDAESALSKADMIVVCTPVTCIADDVIRAASAAPHNALITDVGSTKRKLVDAIERDVAARARFVGSHPLAGSERRGVASSRADLFEGRICVLTPTPQTQPDRLNRAEVFWQGLGCRTIHMSLDEHDAGLARASHVPHAVAAATARLVPETWLELGAGAFRDVTRVAGADPALWSGIFLENRDPMADALAELRDEIEALRRMVQHGDGPAIEGWWAEARRRRERFAEIWGTGHGA